MIYTAAALVCALALSVIINYALVDRLQETERRNEELEIENDQLRISNRELLTEKRIRQSVDLLMEGWE